MGLKVFGEDSRGELGHVLDSKGFPVLGPGYDVLMIFQLNQEGGTSRIFESFTMKEGMAANFLRIDIVRR